MMTQIKLHRGLERMPVFQAFFNFLTDRSGEFGSLFMGIQGRPIQFGASGMEPWMTLPLQEGRIEVGVQLLEADGQVDGFLNYNSDVLDRSTAESMAAAYGKILEAIVRDPNTPIEALAQEAEELGSEREEIAL
jgi:non-ribosomal peptide synthetase component F